MAFLLTPVYAAFADLRESTPLHPCFVTPKNLIDGVEDISFTLVQEVELKGLAGLNRVYRVDRNQSRLEGMS